MANHRNVINHNIEVMSIIMNFDHQSPCTLALLPFYLVGIYSKIFKNLHVNIICLTGNLYKLIQALNLIFYFSFSFFLLNVLKMWLYFFMNILAVFPNCSIIFYNMYPSYWVYLNGNLTRKLLLTHKGYVTIMLVTRNHLCCYPRQEHLDPW